MNAQRDIFDWKYWQAHDALEADIAKLKMRVENLPPHSHKAVELKGLIKLKRTELLKLQVQHG